MKEYQICIDMQPTYCKTIVGGHRKPLDVYKHFGVLKSRESENGNFTVVTAGWYDSAEDGYKKLAEFYNKLKLREG